jgi:serine phosphatase RsbU (regulator of sigma subunit)/anti-sigma regulatory factor (Ser/Thr protein kinase)
MEAGPEGLRQAREFLRQFCSDLSLNLQPAHFLLAVDEAVSNVYQHAYGSKPGPLRLKARAYRRALCVEVVDQGLGFDWQAFATPDLRDQVEGRKKSGLGLWFIRRLTDACSYGKGPDGNYLVLWKRIAPWDRPWASPGLAAGLVLQSGLFAKPLRRLAERLEAVGQGRLDQRILWAKNDELGRIARAFNGMVARLSSVQQDLARQEAMKRELQVAKTIQQGLLPAGLPQFEGLQAASLYRAARDVGGDYFDLLPMKDGRLGLCVADVSGKGVPGSLVMTAIRTAIHLESRENLSPARVLNRLNDFVTGDMRPGMYVTLCLAVLEGPESDDSGARLAGLSAGRQRRRLRVCCAGHEPLILFRPGIGCRLLKPRGFPIGIALPDADLFKRVLQEEEAELLPGDLLVAYTDGIVEAMNGRRERFGRPRLLKAVERLSHLSVQDFVDRLDADVQDFTGPTPQHDDITLVALKAA